MASSNADQPCVTDCVGAVGSVARSVVWAKPNIAKAKHQPPRHPVDSSMADPRPYWLLAQQVEDVAEQKETETGDDHHQCGARRGCVPQAPEHVRHHHEIGDASEEISAWEMVVGTDQIIAADHQEEHGIDQPRRSPQCGGEQGADHRDGQQRQRRHDVYEARVTGIAVVVDVVRVLIKSIVAPDGRHKAQHDNRAEHEDAQPERWLAVGRRVHRSENRFTNVSPSYLEVDGHDPADAGSAEHTEHTGETAGRDRFSRLRRGIRALNKEPPGRALL